MTKDPIVQQHEALVGKHSGSFIFEVLLPGRDARRYVLARDVSDAIRCAAAREAEDRWLVACRAVLAGRCYTTE